MDGTEHHATALDGTRLSWRSAGEGGPAVLLTDGIGCAGYIWRALGPEIARERRVLHWNYRAHGRSAAPADPERMTVEDCVSDLFAVVDAAGEERVVIAGHSMGVQIALEAERRHPERVAGLVLLCGAPGRPLDTFHDRALLRTAFPYAQRLVLRYPDLARLAFKAVVPTDFALQFAMKFEVDGTRVLRSDLVRYLSDLSDVDPTLFVRLLGSAQQHDATAHLPRVRAQALVVAGERDTFTPMRLSVNMHRALPASELVVVPGGTHVAPLEDPELVGARVRAFLAARAPAARPAAAAAPPPPPPGPLEEHPPAETAEAIRQIDAARSPRPAPRRRAAAKARATASKTTRKPAAAGAGTRRAGAAAGARGPGPRGGAKRRTTRPRAR
jgi:pimeloyl-ACP methyl ester carboxylesterase